MLSNTFRDNLNEAQKRELDKALKPIPDSRVYGYGGRRKDGSMVEAIRCYEGEWIVVISRNGLCNDQDKNLPPFASSLEAHALQNSHGYLLPLTAKRIARNLINS